MAAVEAPRLLALINGAFEKLAEQTRIFHNVNKPAAIVSLDCLGNRYALASTCEAVIVDLAKP